MNAFSLSIVFFNLFFFACEKEEIVVDYQTSVNDQQPKNEPSAEEEPEPEDTDEPEEQDSSEPEEVAADVWIKLSLEIHTTVQLKMTIAVSVGDMILLDRTMCLLKHNFRILQPDCGTLAV